MADLPDYYTMAQISEAEAASFKGGLDANKSAAPVSRDIYLATDTLILYVCVTDGTWTGFDASILVQGTLTLYENMDANSKKITSLAAPTADSDAARKKYVDDSIDTDIATHAALTTGVHGVGAGVIVGTTLTQTLTNKRLTSPKINEDVALTAKATELNLLDLAGLTAGELLVATGAAVAAWQSTGVKLSAPDISGVVTAAAALTLPAHASGDITLGASKLKTTSCVIKELATNILAIMNLAEDDYRRLYLSQLGFSVSLDANANAIALNTFNDDAAYFLLKARDTGVGLREVARLAGAADPYFAMGGSQQFKFYYSGVATFPDPTLAQHPATKTYVDARAATKEFFVPCHYGVGEAESAIGDFHGWLVNSANEVAHINFKVPHDYSGITSALIICITIAADAGTLYPMGATVDTDYGALGEAYNGGSEGPITVSNGGGTVTLNDLDSFDISGVLSGIAANDYVGVKLTYLAGTITRNSTAVYVLGLLFKYS